MLDINSISVTTFTNVSPFQQVVFSFVNGFLYWANTFKCNKVPFAYFCLFVLFPLFQETDLNKNIATSVKECSACGFLYEFYGFQSYIQAHDTIYKNKLDLNIRLEVAVFIKIYPLSVEEVPIHSYFAYINSVIIKDVVLLKSFFCVHLYYPLVFILQILNILG